MKTFSTFLPQRLHRRLLLAATGLLLTSATSAFATIVASVSGVSVTPIAWGPSSFSTSVDDFAFTVSSPSSLSSPEYFNVYDTVTNVWLIQNYPVGGSSGSNVYGASIFSADFNSLDSLTTYISDVPASSITGGSQTWIGTNGPGSPVIGSINPSLSSGSVPMQANNIDGKSTISGSITSFSARTHPPAALAFGANLNFVYHLGMPDLAQGPCECAPTSAANSVTWLNNTYGYGLALTTAQIRDTLKNAAHMNTSPTTGTTDANFLAGKTQFATENHLPIETHLVGGGPALAGRAAGLGNTASLANILAELQAGEDVELSVLWGGGGGHWVTLVGIVQLGNQYGLFYNDPDDGRTETRFAWVDVDVSQFLHLRDYGNNTVDTVFAESPTSPPSTTIPTLPTWALASLVSIVVAAGLFYISRKKHNAAA